MNDRYTLETTDPTTGQEPHPAHTPYTCLITKIKQLLKRDKGGDKALGNLLKHLF